jgi:hypothetical protein
MEQAHTSSECLLGSDPSRTHDRGKIGRNAMKMARPERSPKSSKKKIKIKKENKNLGSIFRRIEIQ